MASKYWVLILIVLFWLRWLLITAVTVGVAVSAGFLAGIGAGLLTYMFLKIFAVLLAIAAMGYLYSKSDRGD